MGFFGLGQNTQATNATRIRVPYPRQFRRAFDYPVGRVPFLFRRNLFLSKFCPKAAQQLGSHHSHTPTVLRVLLTSCLWCSQSTQGLPLLLTDGQLEKPPKRFADSPRPLDFLYVLPFV